MDLYEALAAVLADIQRAVGLAQQRQRVGSVGRREGDADRRADLQHQSVRQGDRPAHRCDHPLVDAAGLARVLAAGEDPRELVAAEPRQQRAGPCGIAKPARGLPQHVVAGSMPVAIVHSLEAVEVEIEDGKACAALAERQDRGVEARDELEFEALFDGM